MRPPRGARSTRAGLLRSFQYHFSDSELRDVIEIVNRGDCLYSSWRPQVVEDEDEKQKEKRWPKTRR